MRASGVHQPIGYHMVLRLEDNRVIATTDAQRRTVARSVIEAAHDDRLTAFGLVDTHLHVENVEDWGRCGRLAQRIGTSVKQRLKLPVRFAPVYREPILGQSHLDRAFFYDLRQQDRHGVVTGPYHEASNLPDLLGLRTLGHPLNQHVRVLLPRVNRRRLLEILGLTDLPEDLPVDWSLLPAAAAAAACLPDLSGNRPEVMRARDAAVQAALADGLKPAMIAEILQLSTRWLRKARQRAAAPELVRAVRLQLVLRRLRVPGSNGI